VLLAGDDTDREGQVSNAGTHVDVLLQQVVGALVLLQYVVVDARARERRAEEEAEETVSDVREGPQVGGNMAGEAWAEAHPPRRAPTGLRAGRGAAGAATASNRALEVAKLRVARVARGSSRPLTVKILALIVKMNCVN
jgi:hypothetical protein